MKVLKDIEIAKGVIVKKGADIEMNGFGDLIITRNKESYVWCFNTYDIMDEVISQHAPRDQIIVGKKVVDAGKDRP